MHSVSSTEYDLNMRTWATNLEDFYMLGKLAKGDFFAQDAVYHKECMTKYGTRHRFCLHKKHSGDTVAYVIEDDSGGPKI